MVATEDKEILDDVKQNGGQAILTKKKHYTGTDRIYEAFEMMDNSNIDLIMNLQGDEPLMNIDDIKNLNNQMIKNNDIKIYGDFSNQTSIISFNIEGVHFNDLAMLLDKKNIAIRTGHHCAQPIMDRFEIPGTVRASFAVYNTENEIDIFIEGIEKVKKMFG